MKIKYLILKHSAVELVAELVDDKADTIVLKDVGQVLVGQGKQGMQMHILPWAAFSESNELVLKKEDFLLITEANEELERIYKEVTNKATIKTPPKQGLILPS